MKKLWIPLALALCALLAGSSAVASHTPSPASVNLVGSLESEASAGACGDWDPGCAGSRFTAQANGVFLFQSAEIPAGSWEYKVALGSWAENYGSNFLQDGPNIGLTLPAARSVRFYYDHKTHYIADNVRNTIWTVPGSHGPAIGCPPWAPECLGSLMSDVDGDGVFTFVTGTIPPGSYEFKVAANESWNENYGAGGAPGGANVTFQVVAPGSTVTFSFDSGTKVPGVSVQAPQSGPDGNVEWEGLRHDSRDLLYRTPGGAVAEGTPVKLRFRTLHDDVTSVQLRVYDVNANAQRTIAMTRVAADVGCYQQSLAAETCDFWQATLGNGEANNLWYRFIVSDGADTDYHGDDTAALDGGVGATTDDAVDRSWALTVHEAGFTTPAWARDAVVYQIFPDRFRNAIPGNDPVPGTGNRKRWSDDFRYAYPGGDPSGSSEPQWDRIAQMAWDELPEGYCRGYAAAPCPQRFPQPTADREGPRGRDYYGGDLQGVTRQLDYLRALGITAIYLNPIFASGSNHGYDTRDYLAVNRYLGTLDQFRELVEQARSRGIRVILDGVFNHASSDSPLFDRYHHFPETGACEALTSPWRAWFVFRNENVPCAGSDYEGWFGFDSIPVLSKARSDVQSYFLTGPSSVTRHWLRQGAAGWRLDVSGDPSFPDGYWEAFRQAVGETSPDALTISETWQKDTTLLRILRGDRLDTTMNYRLRDAVLGLLAPAPFDSKGFADSGRQLEPSEFASRLASVREDYADAAYFSLMNLLDSHDTERLLWTLTPGAENRAEKEANAANLAAGKQRVRLASLIQFTVPGAPTVYYGDEVGLTGDDDPDNRRSYPWADRGGDPDTALLAHYRSLAALRQATPALRAGEFRVLLADDGADTVAYGRKTPAQAAVVVVNRSGAERTVDVPVSGWVPDGTAFEASFGGGGAVAAAGGALRVTVPPLAGRVVATGQIDLAPPPAPTALTVTGEGDGRVSLAWTAAAGAASYDVFRSPVSGGGFVKVNGAPVTGAAFTDTAVPNARVWYYVVRALDAAGNASGDSNEVAALPHLEIGWANLQWPPELTHTISATDRTDNVYGQVWIDGVTNQPGPTESLRAQVGFGPDGSNPAGNAQWTWVEATFNGDRGNNDEFVGSLLPETTGTFDYAYRYTTTGGRDWVHADLDGIGNGYSPAQAGNLIVQPSGDTVSPATPTGLRVVTASPAGIELAWDAVAGDPTLHGYEVARSDAPGGPFTTIARVTGTGYTDTAVTEGAEYTYVTRAVDTSFNRSAPSAPVTATAELRTVELVLNVTVPATTDATGRTVYVAGTLNRLDGGLPEWNPGGVALARVDATHWTVTLRGRESTQLEYKFTLGDWEHVEKDAACGEIGNRQLTLSYGPGGTQTAGHTVENWRNVAPCGN